MPLAKAMAFAQIRPPLAGTPRVAAQMGVLRRIIGTGSGKPFHCTTSIAVEPVDMQPDFYKLLVEETPDALIATSREGKVLHWNRGAETTFGYASAEAVGRTLNELTSTCCDEASRAKGLALGAERFLFRPIEPQVLLAEIEACLEGRTER
jgi:PAS domain-containing protein